MGYRPITDMWLMARPKVKYYGAYPSGFLERARWLIGCDYGDSVLHVCGGKARDYPFKGFGKNDKTVDIDSKLEPDYCMDLRKDFPTDKFDGIIIDRPYTEEDADRYECGREVFPNLNELVRNSLKIVDVGKRVGILDYTIPHHQKNTKLVALVGVVMGFNNKIRAFTVFQKEAKSND